MIPGQVFPPVSNTCKSVSDIATESVLIKTSKNDKFLYFSYPKFTKISLMVFLAKINFKNESLLKPEYKIKI